MDEKNFIRSLGGVARIDNFDLSKNTTYGVGGRCISAFFPVNFGEAERVFKALKDNGKKFFVLGKGSNLLVSDGDYDGYVVSTSKLKMLGEPEEGELICGCGTTVSELLNYCRKNGISGLEFLAGIPATLGGLTCMNGGAGKKYISDVCKSVTVFDGNLRVLLKDECDFGYKHSIMRDINCIILSISFSVERVPQNKVSQNIGSYLHARLNLPHGKSCGCVFKNPDGGSAGKLIEDCGLKGFGIGGAGISGEHANFILNRGGTADDIYRTIKFVKEKVYEKFGVLLEEEVVYIGDFDDSYG